MYMSFALYMPLPLSKAAHLLRGAQAQGSYRAARTLGAQGCCRRSKSAREIRPRTPRVLGPCSLAKHESTIW